MGTFMEKFDFDGMSVDELWALYEKVTVKLEDKMLAEQRMLSGRLASLRSSPGKQHQSLKPERRPYPTVSPKFRNPENPTQTWTGRGKQPHWFVMQLTSGRPLDDLRITTSC